MVKVDLGCGFKKRAEDFIGIDALALPGVNIVHDLRVTPWPFEDNSVDFVFCSHFVEHLTGEERIPFFNELYRIMKPGAQAEVITPDWSHAAAYGDPTHKWPPMSRWYLVYLDKQWRDLQVAHVGYTCDFTSAYAYTPDSALQQQSPEIVRHAVTHSINAAFELKALLTKRVA
jgi:ubiquinone/menaquinone biosynthesis C-methylase UbiE